MKLLVDMKLSPKWVGSLAAAGDEAIHWSVLGADNLAHDVIGKQVVDALHRLGEELERGVLVTIEPERTRMRILPLGAIVRE